MKFTYPLKQLRKHVELLHARIGTCDISEVNEVRRQYFAAKLELEVRTELLSDADVDRMSESEAKALLKPKAAKRVR